MILFSRDWISIIKRMAILFLVPFIISLILFYPFKELEVEAFNNQLKVSETSLVNLDSYFLEKASLSYVEELTGMDFLFTKYDLIIKDESEIDKPKMAVYTVAVSIENNTQIVGYHQNKVFKSYEKDKPFQGTFHPEIKFMMSGSREEVLAKFATKMYIRNSITQFWIKTVLIILLWINMFFTIPTVYKYLKNGQM